MKVHIFSFLAYISKVQIFFLICNFCTVLKFWEGIFDSILHIYPFPMDETTDWLIVTETFSSVCTGSQNIFERMQSLWFEQWI